MDKKSNEGAFDVTQGSYGGAEISELIGIYILSNINKMTFIETMD